MTTKTMNKKAEGWIDDLLKKQTAYLNSIQPVDVDVMVEERQVTVRVPFIWPRPFGELCDYHPPRPGVAPDAGLWFNLSGVTRAYPGITIIDDGEEDDLYRVRNKEAVYTWGEIYDALAPEDAQNVRMAIWALHIWEPEQRAKAARAKKAKKEAENG